MCLITGLLVGMLIGAIGFTLLVSPRLDLLLRQIAELEAIVKERNSQVENLKQSINKDQYILEEVSVDLQCEADQIDQATIKEHILDKYKSLIGKAITSIDSDLVIEVVDNRIFRVGNREFQLRVTRVVLTNNLQLWVAATEANGE